jgi:hypothetical protein
MELLSLTDSELTDLVSLAAVNRLEAVRMHFPERDEDLQPPLGLLDSDAMPRLTSLALSSPRRPLPPAVLIRAVHCLYRLESLDLGGCYLGIAAMTSLAPLPSMLGVKRLDLTNRIGGIYSPQFQIEGVRAIADSPYCVDLLELNLWGNRIGTQGLSILLEWPRTSQLRALNLGVNHLRDRDVERLVSSPAVSNLVRLNLEGNAIGNEGIEAILHSRYLGRLKELAVDRLPGVDLNIWRHLQNRLGFGLNPDG